MLKSKEKWDWPEFYTVRVTLHKVAKVSLTFVWPQHAWWVGSIQASSWSRQVSNVGIYLKNHGVTMNEYFQSGITLSRTVQRASWIKPLVTEVQASVWRVFQHINGTVQHNRCGSCPCRPYKLSLGDKKKWLLSLFVSLNKAISGAFIVTSRVYKLCSAQIHVSELIKRGTSSTQQYSRGCVRQKRKKNRWRWSVLVGFWKMKLQTNCNGSASVVHISLSLLSHTPSRPLWGSLSCFPHGPVRLYIQPVSH